MKQYEPSKEFLRVAGVVPEVQVGDIDQNVEDIARFYKIASDDNVSVVTTPELSVTGYSLGDFLHNQGILDKTEQALEELKEATKDQNSVLIVGAPLRWRGSLYNCAVVMASGEFVMAVPKQFLPNQNEFYEHRWFTSGIGIETEEITIANEEVPFGTQQLFKVGDALVGVEICEDAWVLTPPHQGLTLGGAEVVCNLSASPELVGKATFRRNLLEQISAKTIGGYVYVSAGPSESTTDIVMGGHGLIYENGRKVAEKLPFAHQEIFTADIDLASCRRDRLGNVNFKPIGGLAVRSTNVVPDQTTIRRTYKKDVFVPSAELSDESLNTILDIQAHGLIRAVGMLHDPRLVLGLSGGLDSTLALLVAHRTAKILGIENKDFIHCLTMPSFASSKRTQNNARKLAEALATSYKEIAIGQMSLEQLKAIDHEIGVQDVTYENTQARLRTSLLFNYANMNGGLVLGTGDMSEIAQGWCTYNGDHMSTYNVNSSVPKTLVRALVEHAGLNLPDETRLLLEDILDTPVSPELVGDGIDIGQKTEDIIGPYQLHDFFLYNLQRWGMAASKIKYLASDAFSEDYTPDQVEKWLNSFIKRFLNNQFKREAMPNGPKVGTVALSPRGDLRLPTGINPDAILEL